MVGESGCGKSVTAFSILQIVAEPGRIVGGQILLNRPLEVQMAKASSPKRWTWPRWTSRSREMRQIRGKEIAMIFQEPMTSLSMMHTIGFQIIEAILLHNKMSKKEARERAIEMLRKVGIPQA